MASVLIPGIDPGGTVPLSAPFRSPSPEEIDVLQKASREFQQRNYTESLKILEAEGGASPHPEILNMRGAVLSELGRNKEAVAMFQWALDGDPTHFWARYNLAEIALMDGDLALARKYFLGIAPQTPDQKELLALKLLLIDLRSGDEASARRQLPEWPPVSAAGYAAYAAMAHAAGDNAKRAALLSEARRASPEQWDIFLRKTIEESGIPSD
jgi:Flp pilus assembly protein TadD